MKIKFMNGKELDSFIRKARKHGKLPKWNERIRLSFDYYSCEPDDEGCDRLLGFKIEYNGQEDKRAVTYIGLLGNGEELKKLETGETCLFEAVPRDKLEDLGRRLERFFDEAYETIENCRESK